MPDDIHLRPTQEFFDSCCPIAQDRLTNSGDVPAWFRKHFGQGKDIEQQYGLQPDIPLILALALHLSFEMPTADSLKRFRRKIKEARSDLKKTCDRLLGLRKFPFTPLRSDNLWHEASGELELGPDPIEEFVQVVDRFSERLSAARVGRRTNPVPIAVRRLNDFVERNNPALKLGQREALCHVLFDKVRERNGHKSRLPDRDPDETRYIDILKRQAISSVAASAKPGQKSG
jgi:hypothetical protein